MNIYRVTSGNLQAVLRADSTSQVVEAFTDLHAVPASSVHVVMIG